MQRPPRSTLDRLLRAASSSDRELDAALSATGVLPPMELDEIRRVLCRNGTELGLAQNDVGHTIVQVVWDAQLSALIHHDGRVQVLSSAAA